MRGDASAATAAAAATAAPAATAPTSETTEEVVTEEELAMVDNIKEAEDICSDYNLAAFVAWAQQIAKPALVRQALVTCKSEVHKPPSCFPNAISIPTHVKLRDGNVVQLTEVACARDDCKRCGTRGGYRFRWNGPWTCKLAWGRPGVSPDAARDTWENCRECEVCALRPRRD
jgi:hypothetical protein